MEREGDKGEIEGVHRDVNIDHMCHVLTIESPYFLWWSKSGRDWGFSLVYYFYVGVLVFMFLCW